MTDNSSPNAPQASPPPDGLEHQQRRARRPNTTRKLRRNSRNALVSGFLAGIADYIDADPLIVRAAFVVTVVLSGGVTALGYMLFWAIVPADDDNSAS